MHTRKVSTHGFIQTHMHRCAHAHTRTHPYTCVRTRMRTHTQTHTRTHAHITHITYTYPIHTHTVTSQANAIDFRAFDSNMFLILRGGTPRSTGSFPETRTRLLSVHGFPVCEPTMHAYMAQVNKQQDSQQQQ